MTDNRGIIERYAQYLPVTDATPIISLHEGNTPLIYAEALSQRLNAQVWLKFEGMNPTGSFKDRGMTMAISKAVESGAQAVVCASTGNTSAAAAAYAAKAKLECVVIIPQGKIALGKLAQAVMHGARVLQIQGNFDDALTIVREIGAKTKIAVVNSINPFRIEGQKTAAFEVIEVLERAPDVHSIPVGNAGNITAYWMGYSQYASLGKCANTPIMSGTQAAGAAPLVTGHDIDNPETIATAIRIGKPASANGARAAVAESKGRINAVTDDELLEAYRFLAATEGVFCEVSSAASVAGLLVHGLPENAPANPTVVCTLTGHGLKDPATAIGELESGRIAAATVVPATFNAIASELGL